jgi:hypothetical protein
MTRFGRRGLIATVATTGLAVLAGATALAVTAHGTNHTNRSQAGAVAHGQVIQAKPAPKAHHWSIAASGFAPDSLDTPASDYFNNWDPAKLTNTDNSRCFNASVHLPNGATIKTVTFYYTNGAAQGISGELNRQNLLNHKFGLLANLSTLPNGTAPRYTSKTIKVTGGGLVDTSRFAYGLGTCPRGDSAFTGVIITYTG